MHENGNYYTEYGAIWNRYNSQFCMRNNITVIFDKETGTLLKVGERDDINTYYQELINGFAKAGLACSIMVATMDQNNFLILQIIFIYSCSNLK